MVKYDPTKEGAHTSFDTDMSYSAYLSLDSLLSAQHPKSTAHDEMLFIIQHQTSELWLRLICHELTVARPMLVNRNFEPAFKMLTRVARIFEQLNNAWDVLRTMTPSEYTQFRASLGKSSGFQSYQYRQIEFMLGNRNENMMKPHQHDPETYALLQAELDQPSLYDIVLGLLNDAIPEHSDAIQKWKQVYENPEKHWTLYQLAEKLVDLEDYLRRWRFNHVTTVERIIGLKTGTGGTNGVGYLRKMLDVVIFPDLWQVRTVL